MLSWLRLLRFPNVFTAIADVLMGWLVAKGFGWTWSDALQIEKAHIALLVIASICLYLAGMVLNDVWDFEEDKRERPERPLPSGAIPFANARMLGLGLLILGIGCGWGATYVSGQIKSGFTATILAAMIVGYDIGLKRTFIGPIAMGSCRWLNVLMGMTGGENPWPLWQLVLAAGIGIYVAGVTIFAKGEATKSSRVRLIVGLIVLWIGVAIPWGAPLFMQNITDVQDFPAIANIFADLRTWNILWLVLGLLIGMRCVMAIRDPKPELMQRAVTNCLQSIIILDALACYTVTGIHGALAIIVLIIPMMFIGRVVYST